MFRAVASFRAEEVRPGSVHRRPLLRSPSSGPDRLEQAIRRSYSRLPSAPELPEDHPPRPCVRAYSTFLRHDTSLSNEMN